MAERRVLILDDDKEFLEAFAETLEFCGYKAVTTSDTDGFLNIVDRVKPAVILLDLKMPKKTGYLVALELQESASSSAIPVIAMSGFIKKGDKAPKELFNVITCLEKPFDVADALAEIEKALKERCHL